jgi:hypothetical protein
MQRNTTQRNKTQYNTTQQNRTQYNTTQQNTTEYNIIQHNTMQHNTIQHNTIQCNTTQYNVTQYNKYSRCLTAACDLTLQTALVTVAFYCFVYGVTMATLAAETCSFFTSKYVCFLDGSFVGFIVFYIFVCIFIKPE